MQEVLVGLGSCGVAAGGQKVYQRFAELLGTGKNGISLKKTGCIGMCYAEVLVEVRDNDGKRTLYGNVSPEKVARIVDDHLKKGRAVSDWVADSEVTQAKQKRIVLRNCGIIDPDSLDEYLARQGYQALEKV